MRALLLSGCLALVLLTQQAAAQTLLVVGDSISPPLGLDTSPRWVALLHQP
ncbi:arylesterase, partial [Pseudomonas aeruginosa]